MTGIDRGDRIGEGKEGLMDIEEGIGWRCTYRGDLTLEDIKELQWWFDKFNAASPELQDYWRNCHFGMGFRPMTNREKREAGVYFSGIGNAFALKTDKDILKVLG